MSDAALKMLDALWSALGWIEAEEVKHGRKFGAGNAIRDAIFEATGTRPIQDWNDENEEPTETGWYLCDAVDQRWGPGVFKYRALGRGMWWIPLPDGWLSSPVGTYRWVGQAYDIHGPSPQGDDPQMVKR